MHPHNDQHGRNRRTMPELSPPTRPAPTKQDTLSDRLHHALMTEAARRALAQRDIAAIYRLLTQADISQRQIAQLTGQSQSEVSEVLNGRWVMAYDVLLRIAQGLDVPRAWMGLAYDEGAGPVGPTVGEEVIDQDMNGWAGHYRFDGSVIRSTIERCLPQLQGNWCGAGPKIQQITIRFADRNHLVIPDGNFVYTRQG